MTTGRAISTHACRECERPAKARGLCACCYTKWWRENPDATKKRKRRLGMVPFNAERWWSWWESRTVDARTLELREGIAQLRADLNAFNP